jgi:hypothetical protein
MPVTEIFTRRINARQVGFVRIALGVSAALEAVEANQMLRELAPGTLKAAEPWWPQLPYGAASGYATVWMLAALAFGAGFFTRTAGTVLTLLLAYHIMRDQNLYLNHVYLLMLLVIVLTAGDAGRGLSIDGLLGRGASTVDYWPVWLIKVQFAIVYGVAAVNKLISPTFMNGEVLFRQFHLGPIESVPALAPALAVVVVAVEFFIAIGLWMPALRGGAFASGLFFHGSIWLLSGWSIYFLSLFEFAIIMLACYLFFLPLEAGSRTLPAGVDWIRRYDWLGVFAESADARPATFDDVRKAMEALPVSFLWAPILGWPVIRSIARRVLMRGATAG